MLEIFRCLSECSKREHVYELEDTVNLREEKENNAGNTRCITESVRENEYCLYTVCVSGKVSIYMEERETHEKGFNPSFFFPSPHSMLFFLFFLNPYTGIHIHCWFVEIKKN